MSERIEKTIVVHAPLERVWQALTNHEEFGVWFGVKLEGPFVVGRETRGAMTTPGFEGARWSSTTVALEPMRRFAFTWVHDEDHFRDPPQGPSTLVEFLLEPAAEGTRVTVIESGFEALPPERRATILRNNAGGWEIQLQNVRRHVEG